MPRRMTLLLSGALVAVLAGASTSPAAAAVATAATASVTTATTTAVTTASAIPVVTGVVAHGAPDGIWVEWDAPSDGSYGGYLVRRTAGGVTTTVDGNRHLGYSDTAVQPGQTVTYAVAATGGSDVSPWSEQVTATRPLEGWTPAPGARTYVQESADEPVVAQTLPLESTAVQLGLGAHTTTFDGFSVERLPSPGTYDLTVDGAGASLRFGSFCQQWWGPSDHGVMTVHDAVYGAAGVPLSAALDVEVPCGDRGTWALTLRVASAVPVAEVRVERTGGPTMVVQGTSVDTTWRVVNHGNAPATVTGTTATMGSQAATAHGECDDVVLDPGESCAETVTVTAAADATSGEYHLGLLARVAGNPAAMERSSQRVVVPLTAPTLTVTGRSPVGLTGHVAWPEGDLGDVLHTRIERRVGTGAWHDVALPADERLWRDLAVSPGSPVAYRAVIVTSAGESPASAAVPAAVPTDGIVTAYAGLSAGGGASDTDAVVLDPPGTGQVTGVAASPDRRHLAVTTYDKGTKVATLHLTGLGGADATTVASTDWGQPMLFPTFSPDGARVAYSDHSGFGPAVVITTVATGASVRLATQGAPHGWSPDGARLLLGPGAAPSGARTSGLTWVDVATEAATPVPGAAGVGSEPVNGRVAVSGRGDIAWTDAVDGTGRLQLLRIGQPAPQVVLSGPGCQLEVPVFSPDGSRIAVGSSAASCPSGAGTLVAELPTTGTPTWGRMAATVAMPDSAWLATTSLAPTATVALPGLTGPSATASIALSDPDDGVAGLRARCRVDAGPWGSCGPGWSATGLAGGAHTLEVEASDPSGATRTTSASWRVDATGPVIRSTTLTERRTGRSAVLAWRAHDVGGGSIRSFEVRRRTATGSGPFGAWTALTPRRGAERWLQVQLTPGTTVCLSVRGRDTFGTGGPWSPQRCLAAGSTTRAPSAVRGG